MQASKVKFALSGREMAAGKPLHLSAEDAANSVDGLPSLGIHGIDAIVSGYGMDTALTGPAMRSGSAPIQFLQNELPGLVRQLTTVLSIDRIVGMTEAGNWFDEEVYQGTLAYTGKAERYGDSSNIPLANYQHGYEFRSIVVHELGFEVTKLAEAREAAAGVTMNAEKRGAATMALERARQRVGMVGFAGGTRTFGLLNDPGLLPYETFTTWAGKTFEEIVADIQTLVSNVIVQSGGNVDENTDFTLVLPLGYNNYLTTPNVMGMSVRRWITENYPRMRVEFAAEFVGANGGANIVYLIADKVEDGSTDGGWAVSQIVPAKFFTIGSEQRAKSYIEDFGNATAGVMVRRPYLISRGTGI